MTKHTKPKNLITESEVDQFNLLNPLLNGIYIEFQELSKKKPESVLNLYKEKMINRVLEPLKESVKIEPVANFLYILDLADLRTNSDLILILNQYLKALKMFSEKYYENSVKRSYEWDVK